MWGRMAKAVVSRWSFLELPSLIDAMASLPEELRGLPVPFLEALYAESEDLVQRCRGGPLIIVPLDELSTLLEGWRARRPLPRVLNLFLAEVLEPRLLQQDARRLAMASQLLCDGGVEANCFLDWWRRLVDQSVENSNWARCKDVLQEAQSWVKNTAAADGTSLSQEALLSKRILHEAVMPGLLQAISDLPLQLLLDLLLALEPQSGVETQGAEPSVSADRLSDELEKRVRTSLRGDSPALPFMTAISIANGEVPQIRCKPGSRLWTTVVFSIVVRMESVKDIDFFCRCHPSEDLFEAVLEEASGEEDWRWLELQVRRNR